MPDKKKEKKAIRRKADDGFLREQAYADILELILERELKPGERISEVKLSEMLGVSRTPVHEAISLLAGDGLIIREPRRQPMVATFDSRDLSEIFAMRCLLETECAGRAAVLMDRAEILRLRNYTEDVRNHLESDDINERWSRFDTAFHEAIANASGSKRLTADIIRYCRLHFHINRRFLEPSNIKDALDEHQYILEAIEERDSKESSRRMNAHISAWQSYFTKSVEN